MWNYMVAKVLIKLKEAIQNKAIEYFCSISAQVLKQLSDHDYVLSVKGSYVGPT